MSSDLACSCGSPPKQGVLAGLVQSAEGGGRERRDPCGASRQDPLASGPGETTQRVPATFLPVPGDGGAARVLERARDFCPSPREVPATVSASTQPYGERWCSPVSGTGSTEVSPAKAPLCTNGPKGPSKGTPMWDPPSPFHSGNTILLPLRGFPQRALKGPGVYGAQHPPKGTQSARLFYPFRRREAGSVIPALVYFLSPSTGTKPEVQLLTGVECVSQVGHLESEWDTVPGHGLPGQQGAWTGPKPRWRHSAQPFSPWGFFAWSNSALMYRCSRSGLSQQVQGAVVGAHPFRGGRGRLSPPL